MLEQFLFRGQLAVAQVEKLGAVEADPVGPEAAAKTLCVLIEPDRMTGRRKG